MKLQLKTTEGKAILDDEWGTISINGDGGSVKGAVATVDTAGTIDKRITATRMMLTGPLALGPASDLSGCVRACRWVQAVVPVCVELMAV